MTRLVALAAGLVLAAPALAVQPPPAPSRHVPLEQPVGPDEVRRVAGWLKALQGNAADPQIPEAFRDLLKQNPNVDPQKVADEFLRNNPQFRTPQGRAQLEQWAKQLGGATPPGMPGVQPGPGFKPEGGPFPSRRPGDLQLPRPAPADPGGLPPQAGRVDGPGPMPPGPQPAGPHPQPRPGDRTPPALDPETQAKRQQQFQAVARFWERNVGPLRETPGVENVLREMLTGQSDLTTDGQGLGDVLDATVGDGEGFGDWADGNGWKLPDLGKWEGGSPSAPSSPGGSSGGFGSVGEGSWLPVVLFAVAAAVGLVLWWLWPKLTARAEGGPQPIRGLGPWPVDPRTIADRVALVKAFEYLSVLMCGTTARTWNHLTIAAELRRAIPDADAIADPLAKLYALARYTPAGEPLPPAVFADARRHLCRLAGVRPR